MDPQHASHNRSTNAVAMFTLAGVRVSGSYSA